MDETTNEDDLYDEEKPLSVTERYFGLSLTKFFIAIITVVFLGVYVQVLLFGDSSLEVLVELEEYETYLHDEIHRLKTQNAELQKDYFELKELAPD